MKKKSKRTPQLSSRLLCYPEQHFSCLSCGKCCSVWDVPITPAEKEHIESLQIPGIDFQTNNYFTPDSRRKLFHIKKNNGRCVFLDDKNLCLIHMHHSEPDKPLACRVYPFDIFHWDDDKCSAILRSDCPAVARNHGKSITAHQDEIKSLAREINQSGKRFSIRYNDHLIPTLKQMRQIGSAYLKILSDDSIPIKTRFYAAIRLLEYHEDPERCDDILDADNSFSKEAHAFIKRSVDDLDTALHSLPGMNINQRVTLRYLASGFARVDEELKQQHVLTGKLARTTAITKFILGLGNLNSFASHYPNTAGLDPLSAYSNCHFSSNILKPYLDFVYAKLETLAFCGIPSHNFTFVHGLRHLLLSLPVTCLFAALYAASDSRTTATITDVTDAIMIVDHTFIRSPFFRVKHVMQMTEKLCSTYQYPALLKPLTMD